VRGPGRGLGQGTWAGDLGRGLGQGTWAGTGLTCRAGFCAGDRDEPDGEATGSEKALQGALQGASAWPEGATKCISYALDVGFGQRLATFSRHASAPAGHSAHDGTHGWLARCSLKGRASVGKTGAATLTSCLPGKFSAGCDAGATRCNTWQTARELVKNWHFAEAARRFVKCFGVGMHVLPQRAILFFL